MHLLLFFFFFFVLILLIVPAKLDSSLMKEPRMIHGSPRMPKSNNTARRKPLPKLNGGSLSPWSRPLPWLRSFCLYWIAQAYKETCLDLADRSLPAVWRKQVAERIAYRIVWLAATWCIWAGIHGELCIFPCLSAMTWCGMEAVNVCFRSLVGWIFMHRGQNGMVIIGMILFLCLLVCFKKKKYPLFASLSCLLVQKLDIFWLIDWIGLDFGFTLYLWLSGWMDGEDDAFVGNIGVDYSNCQQKQKAAWNAYNAYVIHHYC